MPSGAAALLHRVHGGDGGLAAEPALGAGEQPLDVRLVPPEQEQRHRDEREGDRPLPSVSSCQNGANTAATIDASDE